MLLLFTRATLIPSCRVPLKVRL